jgi:aspartyl-tRNA(Asn)/glutamyl-tRNA(Gln) amidotransferase subunit C
MNITKQQVLQVADLARLELDPAHLDRLVAQIQDILAYMDTLNALDTTGVEPTSHAIALTNAFREDDPGEHLDREVALAGAPERDAESFLVPRVIG